MGESYLGMVSLTYAYKAKDLLAKNGIRSRIVYKPKNLAKQGCGYSLAVDRQKQTEAYEILLQEGIEVRI
jgi:hypothetical protein